MEDTREEHEDIDMRLEQAIRDMLDFYVDADMYNSDDYRAVLMQYIEEIHGLYKEKYGVKSLCAFTLNCKFASQTTPRTVDKTDGQVYLNDDKTEFNIQAIARGLEAESVYERLNSRRISGFNNRA